MRTVGGTIVSLILRLESNRLVTYITKIHFYKDIVVMDICVQRYLCYVCYESKVAAGKNDLCAAMARARLKGCGTWSRVQGLGFRVQGSGFRV